MAEILPPDNEVLTALEGRQVIVILAETGEEQRGELSTFNSDWLELLNAIGHTSRLYRHAVGAIRVA